MKKLVDILNNEVLQMLLSFTYALVLAPWNDPIYFIMWFIVLEIVYLSVFIINPVVQVGIIASYFLGWFVGRQIMAQYTEDPFIQDTDIWGGKVYDHWLEHVIDMFNGIIS